MRYRLSLLALLLLAAGCRQEDSTVTPQPAPRPDNEIKITRPVSDGNEVILKPEPANISKTGDPIENTLVKLLSTATDDKGASAIPNGTRLLHLKIAEGVATLDLSADFNRLLEQGNTAGSLAQNALRKALAQFPQIEKMSVLVEGKPFSDEHSGEWTDIPVRDSATEARSDS